MIVVYLLVRLVFDDSDISPSTTRLVFDDSGISHSTRNTWSICLPYSATLLADRGVALPPYFSFLSLLGDTCRQISRYHHLTSTSAL